MQLVGHWVCPYCGFKNRQSFDDGKYSPVAVYCDNEEGGCDKLSVIDVRGITVDVRVRRVEGEGGEEAPVEPVVHVNGAVPSGMTYSREYNGLQVGWGSLIDVVGKLEDGVSFASQDKAARLRLISVFGETLASTFGAPSQVLWDSHKPLWMPTGASIVTSYLPTGIGWREIAAEWALNVPERREG